jgi:uncharacterized protein YqeY
MELAKQIVEDLKQAMMSKDSLKVEALRFLQSALKNREIELRPNPITEEERHQVIRKLVKQRKESIDQYAQAGRTDLVQKEQAELQILETYLPKAISLEETEKMVTQVIQETGAQSIKDMGKVIKAVIAKCQGACDNKLISELVKQKLS